MSDLKEFEKKVKELVTRSKSLNDKIIKLQGQREAHEKNLKEEFGITPDQIDAKIKDFTKQYNEILAEIGKATSDLETYTKKLEEIVNE